MKVALRFSLVGIFAIGLFGQASRETLTVGEDHWG